MLEGRAYNFRKEYKVELIIFEKSIFSLVEKKKEKFLRTEKNQKKIRKI